MLRRVFSRALSTANNGASGLSPRVKQLIYQSNRRGVLELECLIGPWATRNLPTLAPKGVQQYEELLNIESPILLKILTGMAPIPKDMQSNETLKRIMDDVLRR